MPDFHPRTFFDFGSGVGTGIWATRKFWEEYIYEYYCVDISAEMNDLSEILLKDGFANKPTGLNGVFHRQFLPASNVSTSICYTFSDITIYA